MEFFPKKLGKLQNSPLQTVAKSVVPYEQAKQSLLIHRHQPFDNAKKECVMDITHFSQIHSSQIPQGLQRVSGGQNSAGPGTLETNRPTSSQRDSISFSDEALRMSDVSKTSVESPRIRFDLVNRIKAEINAGTYDTPDKMDIALERLASRFL